MTNYYFLACMLFAWLAGRMTVFHYYTLVPVMLMPLLPYTDSRHHNRTRAGKPTGLALHVG